MDNCHLEGNKGGKHILEINGDTSVTPCDTRASIYAG